MQREDLPQRTPPQLLDTFYIRGLQTITRYVSGFFPSFEGPRCMPWRYVTSRLGGLCFIKELGRTSSRRSIERGHL